MKINQVLQEMQTMQALAQGEGLKSNALETEGSFGELLKNTIDQVNATQTQAASLAEAFELGKRNVSLAEVMIALQKARVSFQALTQVRNKALSAYQEIMNMQI